MRAFLFDLDDTLFDHRYSTRAALAAIRERLAPLAEVEPDALEQQHAIVLEELHRKVLAGQMDVDAARRERFRRLVERYGGVPDLAAIDDACVAYRAAYIDARRPIPGALQVLDALRGEGRIAVVSNNVTAEQMQKLAACGLDRLLDAAVISEDAGVAKPAPEIFHIALARIGATAADAIMIGDSWSADILGARGAGVEAIWYNPLRHVCPDPALICAEIHAWEPRASAVKTILACTNKKTPRV